jgi:TfoX/Sxy family transcriptional regulator of competence genes
MAYDEQLTRRVETFFRKAGVAFETKKMMGGLCLMVNGKMCVGVEKDRLMARIDPALYDEALKQKGCRPMDFTGRPMRGFVFVEPEGLASDFDLKHWLDLAIAFNPKAVASKKNPKK